MTTINYKGWVGDTGKLSQKQMLYFLEFLAGETDKEVAKNNGISPNTVAGARKNILFKLNAPRMTVAIAEAVASGMVRHLCAFFIAALVLFPSLVPSQDQAPMTRVRTVRIIRIPPRTQMEVVV